MTDPEVGRARLLLDAGSVRAALEQAGKVLMTRPDDAEALVVVADARRRLGDRTGARSAAERAVSLTPDEPDAYRALAFARAALRDRHGAIDAARRAVDLAPGDPGSLANLSIVLGGTGRRRDRREALRAAESAAGIAPGDPAILLAYGNALRDAGRVTESNDVFRRILATAPQDFLARHNLAAAGRDPRRDPLGTFVAMADLVGERPDLAIVRHNLRIAAGNLLLRAQSTAWAGWIAALSLMRLTGGQHIDRSLPAAFRIGLPVIAVLVVALLVAFVLQALGRLENRAAGLWRLLLRDDRLALVNAALSVGAVIPLVVAAIVPEQLLPAMLVGGALLGAAAIVGYVRRTALGRSRPSNLVDS